MTDTLTDTVKAAGDVVNAPGAAGAVQATTKPDPWMTAAMFAAGPVLCAMVGCVIVILADHKWVVGPTAATVSVVLAQIDALKDIALGLLVGVIVVLFRLASGQFKHGTVQAGPASMSFDAG